MPTYAAAGGLLAGGPAGLGIGPFLGREAIGLGTGAATRSMTAAGRGQDPVAAAYDPTGVAIDATMSAVPEIFAGSKYAAGKVWNALPDSVTAPVANAAGSAARYVGGKAAGAARSAARWWAKGTPGYGERIVDDAPLNLDDILGGSKNDFFAEDYLDRTTKIEGMPTAEAPKTIGDRVHEVTSGPIRRLRAMGRDDLADDLERRNIMEQRFSNLFSPQADEVSRPFAGATPEVAQRNADVVDAIEAGYPEARAADRSPGAMAQQWNEVLSNPTRYDPAMQNAAQPVREHLAQLAEVGTDPRVDVYDQLMGANKVERAHEIMARDGQAEFFGDEEAPSAIFTQRQLVENGRYFPHQPIIDPNAPELSPIARILVENPGMSIAQAERRLGGLRSAGAVGKSRLPDADAVYNKNIPEVVTRHTAADVRHLANAEAFGGRPVKIKVPMEGGSAREIVVGYKAAAKYYDAIARGDQAAADTYLEGLMGSYAPVHPSEGERWLMQRVSDMVLPRAWLTQAGQLPTGAVMSGGLKQSARGLAMVEDNPILRDIFAAGPQSHEFTDFAMLARGEQPGVTGALEKLPGPMNLMKKAENFLRGPASYAAVPHVYDTAQEAAAMLRANEHFSGALIKKCAEMGTTPEALGTEMLTGELSKSTWLDTIQHLTNRWQHTSRPGDLPTWATGPKGAMAAHLKVFGLKQTQLVKDDIVNPILEGIRTGDRSLVNLGLARGARMAYLGMPANMGAAAMRSVASGRLPTTAGMIRQGLTGPTGTAGDLAYATGQAVTGGRYGDDPYEQLKGIPAIDVPFDTVAGMAGVMHNPARAAETATRAAGMLDPRIPLYVTPAVNLARQLYKGELD